VVLGGAIQEDDGEEDDADGRRGGERGDGDLPRDVEDGACELLPLATVAVDVLDLHRRVVDEHPDRQGEPAQRHQVERLPGELEPDAPRRYGAEKMSTSMLRTDK
jgi:hypothetical protein